MKKTVSLVLCFILLSTSVLGIGVLTPYYGTNIDHYMTDKPVSYALRFGVQIPPQDQDEEYVEVKLGVFRHWVDGVVVEEPSLPEEYFRFETTRYEPPYILNNWQDIIVTIPPEVEEGEYINLICAEGWACARVNTNVIKPCSDCLDEYDTITEIKLLIKRLRTLLRNLR